MPIYEYQCSKCNHQLEVIQKMSDESLTECPECHQPALKKLVSAAGFQLKGTGWYMTDYSARGKARSANEATDSKAAGTDSKSDVKSTETKDASTTDKSSTDSGATT